jgi:hypothetical protein
MSTATTTPAAPATPAARTRALCAAAGAAAAAAAWAIEVPLLGIRLGIRFGTGAPQVVSAGQVIGTALAAGLLGWLALAVADRRVARARRAWTGAALAVLALSLALPLTTATTTAAAVALAVLHLTVGAAVIPALARTARPGP